MPVFRYSCGCGVAKDALVSTPSESVVCDCGQPMKRGFSPPTNLRLAEYAKRENEDSRAQHRQWMETPEVQAKLKTGEYAPDLSNRSCEHGEGVGSSSSILTRLGAGLPIA